MNEWFDTEQQKEKLLGYMPKGRAYKQAYKAGRNFSKFMGWASSGFSDLVHKYNRSFMGMFITESDYLLEKWKDDYSIPSDIFYEHPTENWRDVFVLKYLMRGNKEWNYRAIANIYGIDIIIYKGHEYVQKSRLPNPVPHRIQNISNSESVIVISFVDVDYDKLGSSKEDVAKKKLIDKIKKVYKTIKEAQLRIVYLPLEYEFDISTEKNKIPTYLPAKIGREVTVTNIPVGYEVPERLIFHIGNDHERFH